MQNLLEITMTLPLTIHHAMVALQTARDLLENSAKACDNPTEKENLFDWSDDMTVLLATLELTYGSLPEPADAS
jgi:hypothetical protein